MGTWLIGLDVEHVDDRSLCCGTPPGNLNFYFVVLITLVFLFMVLPPLFCFLNIMSRIKSNLVNVKPQMKVLMSKYVI